MTTLSNCFCCKSIAPKSMEMSHQNAMDAWADENYSKCIQSDCTGRVKHITSCMTCAPYHCCESICAIWCSIGCCIGGPCTYCHAICASDSHDIDCMPSPKELLCEGGDLFCSWFKVSTVCEAKLCASSCMECVTCPTNTVSPQLTQMCCDQYSVQKKLHKDIKQKDKEYGKHCMGYLDLLKAMLCCDTNHTAKWK